MTIEERGPACPYCRILTHRPSFGGEGWECRTGGCRVEMWRGKKSRSRRYWVNDADLARESIAEHNRAVEAAREVKP